MMKYFSIFTVSFLMFLCAFDAHAFEKQLNYEAYASGFRVMEITFEFNVEENEYSAHMDTKLVGILGRVVPWRGSFETSGIRKPGNVFQPLHHKVTDIWADEEEVRVYKYNKEGKLTDIEMIVDGELDVAESDPKLTDGTIDVLSLMLELMMEGSCKQSRDIFDGKRRFTTEFRGVEDVVYKPSKYNVYSGVAEKCDAEIIPKGGKWHKKPRGWLAIQQQSLALGGFPSLSVANVGDDFKVIPVRGLTRSDYGSFTLHLKSVLDLKDIPIDQ